MRGKGGTDVYLLAPLHGDEFKKALKLNFAALNNQAKYEALIAAVKLALELGALKVFIHCDSQLIVK